MKHLLFISLVVLTLTITACANDNNENTTSTMQPEQSTPTENTDQMPGTKDESETNSGTEAEPVEFPENYADGVLYTTVTRGSTFEELYTSREAIEAVQNGQPIPSGTVMTLLIYRDDVLSQYFVMEKRDDGGAHYPPELRNGEWEFQAFTADGTADYEEDINNCLSCHGNQEQSDYLYKLDEIKEYDLEDLGVMNSSTNYGVGSSAMDDWEVNVVSANQKYSSGNDNSDFVMVHDEGDEMNDEEKAERIQEILLTMYLQQYKG